MGLHVGRRTSVVVDALPRVGWEKPSEMRRVIETVSHAPRLELFARRRFEGWDAWGNQVECDISIAA